VVRAGKSAGGVPAVQHEEAEPERPEAPGAPAEHEAPRLVALRASLVLIDQRLLTADERSTAPLAKEKREHLREIEALEKAQPKGSIIDDLASRRESRFAEPPSEPEANGGSSV